jgi:hypothetical protein
MMTRIWMLLATMALAAACTGGEPANCTCVAVAECTTDNNNTAETCGVGLVCCPAAPAGADGG